MANRYLVISDLHLCDVEEYDDGWRYYKSARFGFDDELDRVVSEFVAESRPDDHLTMVLNGDVFDFDLVTCVPDDPPWPVSRLERRGGLYPTGEKSAWKLMHVLAHHPMFVNTLARFVGQGHQLIYVLGNHDRELHFSQAQQVLRESVERAALAMGLPFEQARFEIEPWFFYVPGEIYAEHGQQYDYYNTYRFVLDPTVPGSSPPRLALPMGNLSNRRLLSQMGFFNPHATDYILNAFRYVLHWLKYYAFCRRGFLVTWLAGSFIVMSRLISAKRALHRNPPDCSALMAERARRTGVPVGTLRALDHLHPAPITNRLYRVAREFWLDRAALVLFMGIGTLFLALSSVPLWAKLMVPLSCFPLLYLVYEAFAHGETVFSSVAGPHIHARRIARLLSVKVITFGHSHHPELVPLGPGLTFVDSGTWAPVTRPGSRTALAPGLRNVLTVVVDGPNVHTTLDSRIRIGTQDATSKPFVELVRESAMPARMTG